MPLPTQGDTPDTANNLTYGQSVVGFGDLLKGMADGPKGVAEGAYDYGTKMVEQMGAYLGLANVQSTDPDAVPSPVSSQ